MANHARRVLAMLEILQKTDERHPLTTRQILARLQNYGVTACTRTVGADIAALRDAGCCIMVHRCRKLGYYMAGHTLEGHELRFLCDALCDTPFFTAADSYRLIRKLCTLAAPEQARAVRRTLMLDEARKSRNLRTKYTLDRVQNAIAHSRKLSFSYAAGPEENASRPLRQCCVSPYYTLYRAGRYYLLAHAESTQKDATREAEDLQCFRIDRMQSLCVMPDAARPIWKLEAVKRAQFSPLRFMAQSLDMQSGEPVQLSLLCYAEGIDAITDRFGRHARIRETEPGQFRADLSAFANDGLYAWLMAQGGKVRVLAPESVRKELHARHTASAKQYEAP